MLFFLRCAFWLSIVYASISWSNGALGTRGGGSGLTRSDGGRVNPVLDGAANKAVAVVTGTCKRDPATCLTEAARLTALVDASASLEMEAGIARSNDELMPMPRPRRHGRGAMPARTP